MQHASKGLINEFDWYLAHQDELVKQYNGKVLAIKGQQVIGVHDAVADAVFATSDEHELGTFIVQRCSPGTDDYTAVYHTGRVRVA